MKELNRYDFSNDKAFVTELLSATDTKQMDVPECDVIGLTRCYADGHSSSWAMRPDEALILARLLIDAVWQVTEGYTVGEPKPQHFGGIPIVFDSTVPKDEIHLRQNDKTEAMSDSGICREVWRSSNNR